MNNETINGTYWKRKPFRLLVCENRRAGFTLVAGPGQTIPRDSVAFIFDSLLSPILSEGSPQRVPDLQL